MGESESELLESERDVANFFPTLPTFNNLPSKCQELSKTFSLLLSNNLRQNRFASFLVPLKQFSLYGQRQLKRDDVI